MDDLYVRPEYRGKGIGTQLMDEFIRIAKLENCKQVRWQVSKWNTQAIDFYNRKGAKLNEVEMNCDLRIG